MEYGWRMSGILYVQKAIHLCSSLLGGWPFKAIDAQLGGVHGS